MASGKGVKRNKPRKRQGNPAHRVLEDALFRQRKVRARKGRGSYKRERSDERATKESE